ncbi:sodium/glutamate symporter [Pseudooceanicola sp. LIPI14-2-Ac024]|uniref:sodium/glutamate symporter n=1 Tax=Pseudooceanicola sp. LIPI14-2-Ac024 TaxID=3344875 RepID=UPI0035CF3DE2
MIVPDFMTVTLGMIVYFLGAFLTRHVRVLRDYSIPEPVAGGMIVALMTWGYFLVAGVEITFDTRIRDYLLVVFFTTVGLNARISDLFRSGPLIGLLLACTLVFMVLQNLIALAGARLFGLPDAAAVLLGSASLIGGHGTTIAWGPRVEEITGAAGMAEIGIAMATLGLVVAALIGGPIAKFLIERHDLSGPHDDAPMVGLEFEAPGAPHEVIDHVNLMRVMLLVHVTMVAGYALYGVITGLGLYLPLFVPCLLMGIVVSNTVPLVFPRLPWPARSRSMAVLADYSLSIFLAISLMAMQFWTLSGMVGPLLLILSAQVLVVVAGTLLVFFRVIGGDYTAAVLSAGFTGITLGATPTAIANMAAVTKRYGAAPLAFIALPLVSAFFADLANAVVIQVFIGLE